MKSGGTGSDRGRILDIGGDAAMWREDTEVWSYDRGTQIIMQTRSGKGTSVSAHLGSVGHGVSGTRGIIDEADGKSRTKWGDRDL